MDQAEWEEWDQEFNGGKKSESFFHKNSDGTTTYVIHDIECDSWRDAYRFLLGMDLGPEEAVEILEGLKER